MNADGRHTRTRSATHALKCVCQTAAFDLVAGFLPRLPHGVTTRLGWLSGLAGFHLRRGVRRLLTEELEATLPNGLTPADVLRIARDASIATAKNRVEILLYPYLCSGWLERITRLEGREHLDRVLAAGRGAIVLTAHFGANKILIPLMGASGYTFTQVGVPPASWAEVDVVASPLVRRLLTVEAAGERTWPVEFVDAFDPNVTATVRKRLRAGGVVCLAFDGAKRDRWVEVDFLARRMIVSPNAFRLSRVIGAPVLPILAVRGRDDRHHVRLLPPLDVPDTGDRDRDVQTAAQRMADVLAAFVSRYPEQYARTMVARRRWATADGLPLFRDRMDLEGPAL